MQALDLMGSYLFDVHTIYIGKVELWGEVVEHGKGYRAEYAYPLGFYGCLKGTRSSRNDHPSLEELNHMFGLPCPKKHLLPDLSLFLRAREQGGWSSVVKPGVKKRRQLQGPLPPGVCP
jgi:hypothetical protein